MTLHKLTAGDGYTYLTRQVAAHDSTERGHQGLADYYSERGEAPGRWWGRGLEGVDVAVDSIVDESQMQSLFGHGRHPNAKGIEAAARTAGRTGGEVAQLGRLGAPFLVYEGGATEFQQELARRFATYNKERGLPSNSAAPVEKRAEIRTAVAEELFASVHGRAALDDRELAGFVAVGSRQRTKAVAGYDLTFTPVKSVSALWALADPGVSRQVEEAHDSAVRRTLEYLEEEVLHTRRGRGGVQQVKTRGMLATFFVHRDSRAGDPNLHTHVAVSNKVQDRTGRWLAVDGRVLYKAGVTLSEMYNSVLEAELCRRLPVRFTSRSAGSGDGEGRKRMVRELAGMDPRLLAAWSSRSAAIDTRRRDLAREFQDRHHRPPTATESIALAQQANLETREAKHAPRTLAEQRRTWLSEAVAVLGSHALVNDVVSRVLDQGQPMAKVTRRWVDEVARSVVLRIQEDRASWQVWHLRAEALRQIRASCVAATDTSSVVERVVSRATQAYSVALPDSDPLTSPDLTPAPLTREDGTSVYLEHGGRCYTSPAILAAESRLLAAASRQDGHAADAASVRLAILAARQSGLRLTTTQENFVRQLATSRRRLQVALAPAGSGKTTAMSVLCDAWRHRGGVVRGLAPSAVAAAQLRASLNQADADGAHHESDAGAGEVVCETLSKYAWSLTHASELPWWVQQVDEKTLVIIDEAGMASTPDLDAVVGHIISRGGSIRLIGDDRQLAAVNAGGILRDITHDHGAVTLSEVRRFADTAEAAATLAIRAGDPSAIGFYADRGRLHVGDLGAATEDAFQGWVRDLDHGRSSVLLAPTRDLVRQLNERAQQHRHQDLQQANQHESTGPSVALRDGQHARLGDQLVTRHNDRTLRYGTTDWVKNGDRWTVLDIAADRTLLVGHDSHGARVRLPAHYVAEHVDLGYATTIHGAQGITVDSSHTVLTGQEDRALLYVALSRGRHRNDLYLATPGDGDPHSVVLPHSVHPPTPTDVLEAILSRDGAATSATTKIRHQGDPFNLLRDSALRYHDAVTVAAEHHVGQDRLRHLTEGAEQLVNGIADQPAWPTLRSHLALRAADGHDPTSLLTRAFREATLDDAHDPAAVLEARIGQTLATPVTDACEATGVAEPRGASSPGPLAWLPGIPSALRHDLDWGPYLTQRHTQVARLAVEVADRVAGWDVTTAPAWARPFLTTEAGVAVAQKLAVWRTANGVPDTDPRPAGPGLPGAPGDHQDSLRREANALHPAYQYQRRAWFNALPTAVADDPWIATLCRRLGSLERAGLTVDDYLATALDDSRRPLPDTHPASALWWRIVPHLGPAALDLDGHDDPLHPEWCADLAAIIGATNLDAAERSPAWPALIASVDDACRTNVWTPSSLLTAAAPAATRRAENWTDVADTIEELVLRIASLTDPPKHASPSGAENEPDESYPCSHPGDPQSLARQPTLPKLATDPPTTDASAIARIHELNELAFEFYARCCPRSWVPDYLVERFHTPAEHLPVVFGYAPPGPSSLVRHMSNLGIDTEEIIDAGLARIRERPDGTARDVVDVFRDRLVLPVRTATGGAAADEAMPIAGFIGRRNPHREDDPYAGPKYLNTRATDAFHKSALLYGLAEGSASLEAGAVPVLVEGPMDVIAINVALRGQAVGLAPMGTALTPAQARLLRRHRIGRHDQVVVATDADLAGWRAACADFWLLTAEDLDPAALQLPNGYDPASLLQEGGADALGSLLASRQPLGDALVDAALRAADDWTDPVSRQRLLTDVSRIIAARPAATWQATEEQVTNRLHLSPGILIHQILEQSIDRDADVIRWTRARLSDARSSPDRRLDSERFGRSPKMPGRVVVKEPIALDQYPGRELPPLPTVDR